MKLINADTLETKFKQELLKSPIIYKTAIENCLEIVKNMPTIDAEPVKHARWIIIDDVEKFLAKCSECGRVEDTRLIENYPYCHCGAKMDLKDGESE